MAQPSTFQTWNVVVKRGDDWIREVVARAGVDGDPIDLTGATIRSQARMGDTVQTVTCTITDAAAGAFTVKILHAALALMAVGTWRWDVEVTDSAGVRLTRAGGTFDVQTDYTHD